MEDESKSRTRRRKVQEETEEPQIEEKGKAKGIETIEVTELQEGSDMFISQGYSNIKVTQNGLVKNVKLPIKSSGVTELIEEFKEKEPKPPLVDEIVKKDSEMGKQLKLTKDSQVKVPNLGDEKYVKALNKYESDLGIAILQKGLAVKLLDKEGNEITNPDKKISMLKGMGMSGPQFTQVVQDIRCMTEWTEEEYVNYFGGN